MMLMFYGYIYKITNKIDGRSYVGCKKCCTYPKIINHYWGSGSEIKKAIIEHGKKSFDRRVLCWVKTREEGFELERRFIAELNTLYPAGYNLSKGFFTEIGKYFADKNKIGRKKTKRPVNYEAEGVENPKKYVCHIKKRPNYYLSAEDKKEIGRKVSSKIKDKKKDYPKNRKHIDNMAKIRAIPTGYGVPFVFLMRDCEMFGFIRNNVVKCLNGKQGRKSHYGYEFELVERN